MAWFECWYGLAYNEAGQYVLGTALIVGNDGGFLAINNKGGTVVATVGNEDQGESTIVLYNHDGDFD